MDTESVIQNFKLVESITPQAIWENMFWGIFNIAFAASINNIKNLSLILAKLCDWKNRKLYSGVILNKVKKDPFQYFIQKTGIYCLQLLSLYLAVILFLGMLMLAALFKSISIGIISESVGVSLVGGIILGIPAIVSILKSNSRRRKKNILVYVFAETILIILFFSSIINNVQHFYVMISLITYIWIIIFIFTSAMRMEYSSYNNLYMIISKSLRNTVWIIILYSCCIYANVNALNAMSRIWGIWCSIEYFFAVGLDDQYVVDVTIYLKDRKDVTRDKILKCHGDKVRYINIAGEKVIVNLESITKILINNYWPTNIKLEEKELSVSLIDGTKLLFHDSESINESWTAFYIYEAEEKKTVIYHNTMFDELILSVKKRFRSNSIREFIRKLL